MCCSGFLKVMMFIFNGTIFVSVPPISSSNLQCKLCNSSLNILLKGVRYVHTENYEVQFISSAIRVIYEVNPLNGFV